MKTIIRTHLFFALILATFCLTAESLLEAVSKEINSPQLRFVGARSRALGGSNPTLYGDIGSVFINPSALGSKDVMPASMTSERLIDTFDYFSLNTGFEFEAPISLQGRLKQNCAIAFSYASLGAGGIDQTLFESSSAGGGTIRSIGNYSSGFDMFYLTGSTDLFDIGGFNILSAGTGVKMLRQTVASSQRAFFGLDAGVIGSYYLNQTPLEKFHVGISLQNFLSTTAAWDTTHPVTGEAIKDDAFLPIGFTVGVRGDLYNDQLSLFANTSLDGIMFGAEYFLDKNLTVRGSTNFGKLNIGTGLAFESIAGGIGDRDYGLRLDFVYSADFTAKVDIAPSIAFSLSILGESKPKTPQIFTPLQGLTTREKTIRVAGVGPKDTSILIYNNRSLYRTIRSDRYGNWACNVSLQEGKNLVYTSAYTIDQQSPANSESILITSDSQPPKINIKIYPEGRYLMVSLDGSEELDSIRADIEGVPINFGKNGTLWYSKTPLPSDLLDPYSIPSSFRTVQISATDKAGNVSSVEKYPYFVAVDFPKDKTVHYRDEIRFLGRISKTVRGIEINNQPVYVDSQDRFSAPAKLAPGKNLVRFAIKTISGDDLFYKLRILRLSSFPDVDKKIKERREIEFMATLGVLDGDTDGNFYPNKQVTRRYMARTITKLKKVTVNPSEGSIFADVPQSDLDSGYIQAALQNGLMFAYPDGSFKPDQPMTLSEILYLLNNAGVVDETQAPNDANYLTRKELAQYLAYTAKYEVQIERLIDWDKGYIPK